MGWCAHVARCSPTPADVWMQCVGLIVWGYAGAQLQWISRRVMCLGWLPGVVCGDPGGNRLADGARVRACVDPTLPTISSVVPFGSSKVSGWPPGWSLLRGAASSFNP
eukprot:18581-Chlamydomonas_euryale.AAC.1